MDIQILFAAGIIVIALIMVIRWRIGMRYGKIRPRRDVTKVRGAVCKEEPILVCLTGW
jgi:hypothetical protein